MSDNAPNWSQPDVFTGPLIESLKRHPKRIVFSEGEDERVIRVAGEMVRQELGIPILLGKKEKIRAMAADLGVSLKFVNVTDPAEADDLPLFAEMLERIERLRGVNLADAKEVASRPHFYASMMIQYGQADGMVGGNQLLPETIHRALIQLVKPLPDVPHVFTSAIMVSDQLEHFGPEGILFLADCGLNDIPDVSELKAIAIETGRLAHHYKGRRVRIAMLSHSTMNSAATDSASRVRAATEAARQEALRLRLDMEIDGELQADVALDASAAEMKLPQMVDRPAPDVLVFPNLDAAHISMKLLRHVGGATKYGQMVLGLSRPAAQVSRTADERALFGTALAIGAEAIKYHELFPHG
ncbi:MAG: phosphate acyltransferase [Verrucomicrobiota bacterium JB023]|nr:phosphate acyltransferase [Verrucomicrobiota bacterium JB023]